MRVSVLASILLAVSCGGSGSPTASAPVPPVSLPDGNYQLAVYSSGFNCVMATYGSGGTPGSSVRIPVAVALDGDHWRVGSRDSAAGSLTMTLARTDVGVNGSALGTLAQPGVLVTLQHQVNGTANGPAAGVVVRRRNRELRRAPTAPLLPATNLWSLTKEQYPRSAFGAARSAPAVTVLS
jgi:hypothetical protein